MKIKSKLLTSVSLILAMSLLEYYSREKPQLDGQIAATGRQKNSKCYSYKQKSAVVKYQGNLYEFRAITCRENTKDEDFVVHQLNEEENTITRVDKIDDVIMLGKKCLYKWSKPNRKFYLT